MPVWLMLIQKNWRGALQQEQYASFRKPMLLSIALTQQKKPMESYNTTKLRGNTVIVSEV
jgi:hypothetical protein